MNSAAHAFGPGFDPGAWGFHITEELKRAHRARMTGHGHGPWGPPGPGGRGRRGPGAWGWGPGMGGPGWGFGPGGPEGRGRGGRGRAGRGDIRTAILALLAEEPRHGYQLIQDITERSGGAWKPSPGSIYPALSALQDEGLVDDEKIEGRRVFSLTAAGREHVAGRAEELEHIFDANSADEEESSVTDLRALLFSVGAAAFQVVSAGTPEQGAAARTVLTNARRDLYRILAEDGGTEDDES